MKQLLTLAAAAVVSLLATSALPSQEDPAFLSEERMRLVQYEPQQLDLHSLYQTVNALYGRDLEFEDRVVDNLMMLDSVLVIYELPDRAEAILKAVQQLDAYHEGDGDSGPHSRPEFDRSEVELLSYAPKYTSVGQFLEIASELYGRTIKVDGKSLKNIRHTDQAILIYDQSAHAQQVLAKLQELDESQRMEMDAQIEVLQYRPRFVSLATLSQALQPFRASFTLWRDGSRSQTVNITEVSDQGMLLVRDFEDNLAEIKAAIEAVDRPSPQILVSAMVVKGTSQDSGNAAPSAIQEHLRKLLPYESYQVQASGLLRTTSTAHTPLQLEMDGRMADQYRLTMNLSSYDADTGLLNLSKCEFMTMPAGAGGWRSLFSTSTQVYGGEHAVLGMSGAEPLFLILKVEPVETPSELFAPMR